MKAFVVGLLLGAGVAAPAMAQRVSTIDGAKFLAICTGHEAVGCDAYIAGVADTVVTYRELARRPDSAVKVPPDICVPADVTGTRLRQVVVEWLRGNQADRGKPAHQLVYRALLAAYPCK